MIHYNSLGNVFGESFGVRATYASRPLRIQVMRHFKPFAYVRRLSTFIRRPATAAGAGFAVATAFLAATSAFSAYAATIDSVRLGDRGAETRFVVEFAPGDPAPGYRLSTLAEPYRLVVDLPTAKLGRGAAAPLKPLGIISGYKATSEEAGQKSRLTVRMKGPASVSKQFFLPAQAGKGPRLVIDLLPVSGAAFVASGSAAPTSSFKTAASDEPVSELRAPVRAVDHSTPQVTPVSARSDLPQGASSRQPASQSKLMDKKLVIVLDPGHGGVDPGTHGPSGVEEKTVTLAFARELAKQLRASGRYTVYLTRGDDTFIPLRGRVAFARARHADLFMSIHADSIQKKNIRGMSIYTLSETASDKEAEALAQKENRADVIAGIDLKGETPEVTDILIDLAQRETKNYSSHFARSIVSYAGQQTVMLDPSHRFAGFAVLKAPDVPSVLVELGFLTNPKDERELTSPVWRRRVAGSFIRAIDSYFGEQMVYSER